MSKRLVDLTLDNLSELGPTCRSCVFWELDAVAAERACAQGSAPLEKEAWVSDTLLQWGTCGQLAYVDGQAAGHVLYAPPAYVPRSASFPTSPVSPDAVLLMTARLDEEFTGAGLGRMLMQGTARDLVRRGVRAIEAFGRTAVADGTDPGTHCLVPADYLLSVGFKTVRRHRLTPRLRLDLRTTASWKEDVEYAIDKLLGSMHSPVLAR